MFWAILIQPENKPYIWNQVSSFISFIEKNDSLLMAEILDLDHYQNWLFLPICPPVLERYPAVGQINKLTNEWKHNFLIRGNQKQCIKTRALFYHIITMLCQNDFRQETSLEEDHYISSLVMFLSQLLSDLSLLVLLGTSWQGWEFLSWGYWLAGSLMHQLGNHLFPRRTALTCWRSCWEESQLTR